MKHVTRTLAAALTTTVLAAVLVLNAAPEKSGVVEIAKLDAGNWNEFAPAGKEVDAIYGDLVLRNEHLVAVIAQPLASRNANMTVRDVGGCLIDLTVRWNQSDQLSCYFPGARQFPYRSSESRLAAQAGSDLATIEPGSKAASGSAAAVTVRSIGGEKSPLVEVTYQLDAGSKSLVVTTRFTNQTAADLKVPLTDDLRIDAQKDDIVRSPNGTGDLFWFHDRFWGQAGAVQPVGLKLQADSNSRTATLKYVNEAGNTDVTLKPGEHFEFTRRVFPGSDAPHIQAIVAEINGKKVVETNIAVRDGRGQPIGNARVHLHRGGQEVGSVLTDPATGVAKTWLEPGPVAVSVEALGVEIVTQSELPAVAASGDRVTRQVTAENWKPGIVQARIVDGNGDLVPCKIEFFAKAGTAQPWFGPETADFGVLGLKYVPLGELTSQLPPGEYEVAISHGPEFDAIFTELTVPPGKTVPLTGTLKRVVNSTGWVSSDFHSHSSPSGDNTGSQLGRVLNLVCDQIEFAPCTEHNRIDTYQPHIDRLKIGQFINSCTGMELTGSPLLLNHQNSFPLKYRPHLQDGGGPVTDGDIETQVERLALWDDHSEKLVQINHPDLGWLLRDRNGDGIPDEGHSRILPHIDVIEIHPVPDILTLDPYLTASTYKGNNRIFNWLQYLNQGYRFVGVVNTDAHYNYHESGWLRNWIRSPTDEPSEIKTMDIVRASEAGALFMSNGPFLDVTMRETGDSARVIAGQDLEAPSKKITIDVEVQCPNWLEIDRVFVLINGRIDPAHHYRRATHPDRFRSGVVKFSESLDVKLERDAHVIVVAGADNSTLGRVHGPQWGQHHPAAFINPVFVDVDGGGISPSKDTLGYPLPVRFGYPKTE